MSWPKLSFAVIEMNLQCQVSSITQLGLMKDDGSSKTPYVIRRFVFCIVAVCTESEE